MILPVRPGDVRATIADPALPWALTHAPIATVTGHWAVHATIVETSEVEIHPGPAVVRRQRAEWDRYALILRHPDPELAARVVAAALEHLGGPYDFLGALVDGMQCVTGIDLPETQGPGAVCSRFVARMFRAAGDPDLVPGVKEGDVLPGHLVERSRLEVVGYQRA